MHQRGHILVVAIHLVQDLGTYKTVSTFCSKASNDKGFSLRVAAVGGTDERLHIAVFVQRAIINENVQNGIVITFCSEEYP